MGGKPNFWVMEGDPRSSPPIQRQLLIKNLMIRSPNKSYDKT